MRHRVLSLAVMGLSLVILTTWSVPSFAQDKTYVQVGTILGESTDPAHLNWINAYALDGAVTVATGGGGGAGVASFSPVAFLKGTDRATPHLYDAAAMGSIFPLVTLEVCRTVSGSQQCYYRVELTNASVVGVSLAGSSCVGSGACTPAQTESVSFNYTRIKWIYTPWSGGSPGTQVTRCFDLVSRVRC